MPTIQHRHLLFSGRLLKPDLFDFRANLGVFEDAGTDPAEDTDPVYQWNDQSWASRFATQATLANRPSLSSAAAPNYLAFDGSDDRMTFGGSTVMCPTGSPWSFEIYVRLTDFTALYPHLLSLKTATASDYSIAMSDQVGYLGVHIGSSASWSRLRTGTAAASLTGADRHIVVTYNGAGATTDANFCVYIDGVKQSLVTASAYGAATTTTSIIGMRGDSLLPFKGRIYRAAGFSRELTQAQVSSRFALGFSG